MNDSAAVEEIVWVMQLAAKGRYIRMSTIMRVRGLVINLDTSKTRRWFEEFFFFQAEDGIRDVAVTGVQTCALPISLAFFKLRSVCAQHLLRRSILRQIRRSLPALVFDADSCEVIPYLIVFEKRPLFVRNSQQSHGDLLLPVAPALTHSVRRRIAPEL